MDALKICINVEGKTRIFYTDIVSNYKTFLNKCEDEFTNVETMFKYWIDDDGDKVEINGEHSYKMFLKLSSKKRIFIEKNEIVVNETIPMKKQSTASIKTDSTNQKNDNPIKSGSDGDKIKDTVHHGVGCDQCNMLPIIGFRYKCLECPDFDLCMVCESKRLHDHHRMMRIPTPQNSPCNSNNSTSGSGGLSQRFTDQFNDFAVNIDIPIKPVENNEREQRRRKHNHKRCSGSSSSSNIHQIGSNVLTNLFQMMQGMADNSTANNATTNVSNKTDENHKDGEKSDNKANDKTTATPTPPSQPEKQQTSPNQEQIPPQQEQQQQKSPNETQYDSETIRAGAEILNKMFGKFLDPVNVGVHVGVCPFTGTVTATATNFTSGTTSNSNENPTVNTSTNTTTNTTTTTITTNEDVPKSANETILNTPNSTEKVIIEDVPEVQTNYNNWKSTDGAVGGLIDTEIVPIIQGSANDKPSIEKQNSQEDIGWTLIDNEKSIINNTNTLSSCNSVVSDSIKLPTTNEAPIKTEINYAQLSKSLEKHIKEEEEEQRKKQSLLSDVVYHEKPHINNAVIAMIAMGFSNEGKWLTHLLESVDGDISRALDHLKPTK